MVMSEVHLAKDENTMTECRAATIAQINGYADDGFVISNAMGEKFLIWGGLK